MCIILEGWQLADTHTRLCRVHSGCFKASLLSFTPLSPKTLSTKHKRVSLLLLMRAKERSSQPATVSPQLSKLKEKDRRGGIGQFPKCILLFSFTGKLAGTHNPYISTIEATSSNLLKSWIPLQLWTGYDETKHRRREDKPQKQWK